MRQQKRLKKPLTKQITNKLAFLLPASIPLLLFWIIPILKTFYVSFTDWDYISSDYNFVGLQNYRDILTSSDFYQALNNTVVFTLGTVIPTIIVGLLLAVLLNNMGKMSAIYKSIIFSPWITPTVAVSIVWCWIFEPENGFANFILGLFNIPGLKWLNSSSTAMLSIIIVTVWKQIGWAMMFYVNAINRISPSVFEASKVDGAGRFKRLINITIPLVSPTTFLLSIILTIDSLKAYDSINVLTQGGPSGSTRTLLYLYYEMGFENFNIGQACSIAIILLVVVSVFSLIQFIVSKKWLTY